jgi:dephospho-CoA kinase
MIKIGLTGGMGCGKTTAARLFAEEGFRSLDADEIVHDLLANDAKVRQAIDDRFGSDVLDPEGRVDRRKLGTRVFADSEALAWLEQLLHPLVGRCWRETIARGDAASWVVQIPLLFEKRLEQFFDFTVCVGTSAETQRRRLLQRGLSDQEVARRIARQLPLEEKTAKADFFLLNDGSPEFLREQVQWLCRKLDPVRSDRPS